MDLRAISGNPNTVRNGFGKLEDGCESASVWRQPRENDRVVSLRNGSSALPSLDGRAPTRVPSTCASTSQTRCMPDTIFADHSTGREKRKERETTIDRERESSCLIGSGLIDLDRNDRARWLQ